MFLPILQKGPSTSLNQPAVPNSGPSPHPTNPNSTLKLSIPLSSPFSHVPCCRRLLRIDVRWGKSERRHPRIACGGMEEGSRSRRPHALFGSGRPPNKSALNSHRMSTLPSPPRRLHSGMSRPPPCDDSTRDRGKSRRRRHPWIPCAEDLRRVPTPKDLHALSGSGHTTVDPTGLQKPVVHAH